MEGRIYGKVLRREWKSVGVMEGESGDAETGKLTWSGKVMNLEAIDEVEADKKSQEVEFLQHNRTFTDEHLII